MPRFRKKPIVIDAEQFLLDQPLPFRAEGVCCSSGNHGWYIQTPEGPSHISEGDWIIRGVKGEFYPCKPAVFAATYEPVFEEERRD